MKNVDEDADIDFLVVVQKGTLWLSRLICLAWLICFRIPIRRYANKSQENRLCLNIWLDESDLAWFKDDRNLYTAHEIAQIIPLVNKERSYEKFLYQNRWILDWWPNAVRIGSKHFLLPTTYYLLQFFETKAYGLQVWYMRSKVTREIITATRAIFHPNDFGRLVLEKLKLPLDKAKRARLK